MNGWKVFYRDDLDHDRISPSVFSSRPCAKRETYIKTDGVEYTKLKDLAGYIVHKDEVMRWVSAHRWR